MTYKDFLLLIAQMRMYQYGTLSLGEISLLVKKLPGDFWEIRTALTSFEGEPPFSIFRWQAKGCFLEVDKNTNHIFLVQEIMGKESYIFLRDCLKNFQEIALEWKEILSDAPLINI